jgi:hypothetical protein
VPFSEETYPRASMVKNFLVISRVEGWLVLCPSYLLEKKESEHSHLFLKVSSDVGRAALFFSEILYRQAAQGRLPKNFTAPQEDRQCFLSV